MLKNVRFRQQGAWDANVPSRLVHPGHRNIGHLLLNRKPEWNTSAAGFGKYLAAHASPSCLTGNFQLFRGIILLEVRQGLEEILEFGPCNARLLKGANGRPARLLVVSPAVWSSCKLKNSDWRHVCQSGYNCSKQPVICLHGA